MKIAWFEMKIEKIYFSTVRVISVILAVALAAGCSLSGLDEPEPYHRWSQAEVEAQGYRFMTIWEFKKNYFYDKFSSIGTASRAYTVIEDRVAIRGKVISSDLSGNIYRSLYIQDETGTIEIKAGSLALHNDYKPGQTLFVKCDGLSLGNYRYMLSLGAMSEDDDYANGYIDLPVNIEQSILRGPLTGFTQGRALARGEIDHSADTMRIDRYNVDKLRDPQDLGRLVRIEGLESVWGMAAKGAEGFSNNDIYPSFLQSVSEGGSMIYTNWYWKDGLWTNGWRTWPVPEEGSLRPDYPTWAFRDWGHNYYGSALFGLGDRYFVVRSNPYANFAWDRLPEDGERVDITAIYTKFSSASGEFPKWQLLLNSSDDVVN